MRAERRVPHFWHSQEWGLSSPESLPRYLPPRPRPTHRPRRMSPRNQHSSPLMAGGRGSELFFVFLCTRRSITLLEVSAEYHELGVPHVRPTQWANVGFFVFLQMPKSLVRRYGHGDLHFVTFSCYRRLALLGTARARNVFVRALGEVRKKYAIQLVGYVVMPEHVHLLIGESKLGMPSTWCTV
jgi:hypothetical protein